MKIPNIGNTLFLKDFLESTAFDDLFDFKEEIKDEKPLEYSPKYVRGSGSQREGYCIECEKWYNMKNSSYWYHMNYKHGINCKGEKYPSPKLREIDKMVEGYCIKCGEWICLGLSSKNYKFSWLRHMQKIHKKEINKQ